MLRCLRLACLGLALLGPRFAAAQGDLPLGLGVASPTHLGARSPLFFYGSPTHPSPLDSLTVREGPHHVEIASAPPWLDAAAVSLVADGATFRVVALHRDRVQVVVHVRDVRWPPQTMWIDRAAVAFRPWEVFLLDVGSVSAAERSQLRSGPSDATAVVGSVAAGQPLHVVEVQREWLRVQDA
jgi:hypothetical protein